MTAFFAYNKDDIDTKINSDFVWPVRIYTLVIRTGFRLLPKIGKSLVQLIEEYLPNSAAISHKAQTHHPGV